MSMRPFQGRCHTCGHDHDSEAVTLRDVMDIGRAAQEQQVAELHAAVARVRGVLRELVAVRDIEEKYSQSRPDSPYARNWSQFVADTSGLRQRSDRAWAAARAELGEKT